MSIYLDAAATTKPIDSIIDVIKPYLETKWHNPSSIYSAGVIVKKDIEEVRKNVSDFINANSSEIYFTSGACESNNWVVRGFDDANFYKDSVIITTPIEHNSIIDAISNPVLHSDICFCKVNSDGSVNMESLKGILELNKHKQILVSVGMGNSEIGTIQDIKTISSLVHSYNGIFHTDATQTLKDIPIDVNKMGIDLLSASSQKIGGLKGTGFLYKRNNVLLSPLLYGSQERNLRGGTENVIGIVALGEAIRHISHTEHLRVKTFRDKLITELEFMGCKLNGSRKNRLSNNINVVFPKGISGEAMIYVMDCSGVYLSAGSACNSHSQLISHVLESIGLTNDEALRTIRITLPDDITADDIDLAVSEFKKAIKILGISV